MYKYRTESWGKKLNHDLEWTTCYTDHINGYGHFHNRTDMHVRKQPKSVDDFYRPFFTRMIDPEPQVKPNIDHMWHVLNRKGPQNVVGGNTNVRARLKKMLREGQKRKNNLKVKSSQTEAVDALPKQQLIPSSSLNSASQPEDILTPTGVKLEENYPSSTLDKNIAHWTSRDPPPSSPQELPPKPLDPDYYPPLWSRHHLAPEVIPPTHYRDPVMLPVAGIPTVWNVYKPRHHLSYPPPYVPQPIPLPFSEKHNQYVGPIPRFLAPGRRRNAEAVTQTTPAPSPPPDPIVNVPPAKQVLKPLPGIQREPGRAPDHPVPKIDMRSIPKPRHLRAIRELPNVSRRGKTGVDISWLLDRPNRLTYDRQGRVHREPWKSGVRTK